MPLSKKAIIKFLCLVILGCICYFLYVREVLVKYKNGLMGTSISEELIKDGMDMPAIGICIEPPKDLIKVSDTER